MIKAKNAVFDRIVTAITVGDIEIGGHVYLDRRPGKDEDIVVNSIAADSEPWQNAVVNVNCYVPDLQVNVGGKTMLMPDQVGLQAMMDMVYPVIRDYTDPQRYRFYVESMRQGQEEKEEAHYINFRVQVLFKNY